MNPNYMWGSLHRNQLLRHVSKTAIDVLLKILRYFPPACQCSLLSLDTKRGYTDARFLAQSLRRCFSGPSSHCRRFSVYLCCDFRRYGATFVRAARADVSTLTGITVRNLSAMGSSIYLGDDLQFTVTWDGDDLLTGVVWSIRATGCGADQEWQDLGAGNQSITINSADPVGSYQIQAVCTFVDSQMDSSYNETISTIFTVKPPDGATLISGFTGPILDTNLPLTTRDDGPNISVAFLLLGAGRVLSVPADGGVQESLVRSIYGRAPNMDMMSAPFLTWGPPITDMKGVVGDDAYIAAAAGLIDEYDQSLEVVLADGCGVSHNYPVGTWHFQMIKIDNNSWQLHLVSGNVN